MRIPFDLIAAVILLDSFGDFLVGAPCEFSLAAVAAYWTGFILVAWLLSELLVRRVEWAADSGPSDSENVLRRKLHPAEMMTWGTRLNQALVVALYALVLWSLQWPLFTQNWPRWLGLDADATLSLPHWFTQMTGFSTSGGLRLADSSLAATLLNLGPFLIAMICSWIPKRRLISGRRRRAIALWPYILFEIKLSWIPLLLWIVQAFVRDASALFSKAATSWMAEPGIDILVALASITFISVIALPRFIVWWWKCTPLPEGELKDRLLPLMKRSGVKARAILVWGPRNSGLLNACVMGPWARFRYVLISPLLVDELGLVETEAVLAHELGHAQYGHLTLLFFAILCMSLLLEPLVQLFNLQSTLAETALMVGFVILYIWGFVGSIMRRCEREADLASAELLGTPRPLINALERLASISGNIRNVYCWHHGSIAQRVEGVEKLSQDPQASLRLHQELRRIRILLISLTLIALGSQFWHRLW